MFKELTQDEKLDYLLNRVRSLFDTDLYKLTMLWAVICHFPDVKVRYEFINRDNRIFPKGFGEKLGKMIYMYRKSKFEDRLLELLYKKSPYLPYVFIDFLRGFKMDPSEVMLHSTPVKDGEKIQISIEGYWYRAILWEVMLMSDITELYHVMNCDEIEDTEGVYHDTDSKKATYFKMHGMKYADFGTRRRHSFINHERVVKIFKDFGKGSFVGSSNVLLSLENDLTIIGTFAHEWVSGVSALLGYAHGNQHAMELWSQTYKGRLGIALTDTFGLDSFLRDFDVKYAKLFDGVRHDSADPFAFADKIVEHYKSLNIDPLSKTIVFSDSLNPELARQIHDYCRHKINCSFGIGTNLTNDVGLKPLNIVIKLFSIDGKPAIKLSDVEGKHTGDKKTIDIVKTMIGYKSL